MIDITIPLCRGRVITLPSGEKTWINFKYERLPSLCYWCGRLNHDDRDCDLWMESNETLSTKQQQFGPFLCAPPFKTMGKDVIYISGFFKKTNRRSQWGKQREEEVQVTGGGNSDTVEPAMEAAMECELDLPSREEVTVMEFNAQSNTVKERVTGESQSSNQYTQNGKKTALPNLGSNDRALKSVVSVIDCANYADSSLLEKVNRVTEKDVNTRVLNSDLLINANPTETKEMEAKSNSVEATLAAPSHEKHMPLKLEQLQQTQPMVEEGEQPKNIRSWKHL